MCSASPPGNRAAPPAVISVLSDIATPVSLFHRLASTEPFAFLYESTEGDNRLARYSFMAVDPVKTISFFNGKATIVERTSGRTSTLSANNPLKFLEQFLKTVNYSGAYYDVPFSGGLVGYLGYAATANFEGIRQQLVDPLNIPDGYYALYDSSIVFDHQQRLIKIISHRGLEHAERLMQKLSETSTLLPLADKTGIHTDKDIFTGVESTCSKNAYIDLVNRCKEYISEGQVFQIVLAHRFFMPVSAPPLDVYRHLVSLNPSPYGYLLKYPGFTYIGSSPETFVKCQSGEVILRALAGTRRRGFTEEEDGRLADELVCDEKELAEHRMLVDLGRNDLGRICEPGSIKVGDIATIHKYRHVMHLSTEIKGTLRSDKTIFDAFQSCFPRGTVSGAPKVRAMQLLSELEPERRGIYSGVVGYFDFSGNADGAIAIRSALLKDGVAHVHAGAGIVYDSIAEHEYKETLNKAMSIIKALKLANSGANQTCMQSGERREAALCQ